MCEEKKSKNHQNYLNTNFLVRFQLEPISSVKIPAFEPILFYYIELIELYVVKQNS